MSRARVERALVVGFIVLLAIIKTGTVLETDVFWQIREGQELLDGAPLDRPDTWSWSPPTGSFMPNSPAWAVFVGAAWRVGGSWALWAVTAAYLIGCLLAVVAVARWLGARWIPIALAVLIAAVCSMPLVSPRSSIGSVTLLLLTTWFGVWFGERWRSRPVLGGMGILLATGAAVALAGNWWHASWATLAAIAAVAWWVTWVLLPGYHAWRVIGFGVAGSVGLAAGVLLGPMGLEGWSRSAAVLETCRGLITEWMGPFVSGHVLWYGVPAVLLAAGIVTVLAVMVRRWWGRWRLAPRDALTCILAGQAAAFAVAGVVAVRFLWFAFFLFAPVIARGLSAVMGRDDTRPDVGGRVRRAVAERTSDRYWLVILAVLLVVLLPFGIYKALPHGHPVTADAVAALPADCRLFSTDADANAVLLLRPDVRVWIDGRSDSWGRPRLIEALTRFAGRGTPNLVPEGTTCILLPAVGSGGGSSTDGLVSALQKSPDWREIARADESIIWVPAQEPSPAPRAS